MNFLPKQLSLLTSLVFSITFAASASTQAKEFAQTGIILTSIKPLQLIAADITQGVIAVESLLPAGASPHSYSLRPSEVKRIHGAKRIFWVGPAMENFLRKPFSKYPDKTHSFTKLIVSDALLPVSQENNHSELDDEHQHETQAEHEQHLAHQSDSDEHEDEHDHQHEAEIHQHKYLGKDPHIWLSPNKALQMAAQIRDQVSVLYPQHEQRLSDNFEQFSEQMKSVDLKLRAKFSPLKALGFLVFHDAYSRFVDTINSIKSQH
jgi:zinc transport system substrate-binding protein